MEWLSFRIEVRNVNASHSCIRKITSALLDQTFSFSWLMLTFCYSFICVGEGDNPKWPCNDCLESSHNKHRQFQECVEGPESDRGFDRGCGEARRPITFDMNLESHTMTSLWVHVESHSVLHLGLLLRTRAVAVHEESPENTSFRIKAEENWKNQTCRLPTDWPSVVQSVLKA